MSEYDHTIDALVLTTILDRLKNIVAGTCVRYTPDNDNQEIVFNFTGTFILTVPAKIEAVCLQDSVVQFTYNGTDTEHDFSISNAFTLFDTGLTITVPVDDLPKLKEDDTYDIRCNNSTLTISEVRSWKLGVSNTIHPLIEVYPSLIRKTNKQVNDRISSTASYDLKLELDVASIDTDDLSVLLLDICGDVSDEIQRDPRMKDEDGKCLTIDASVTDIIMYVSEANDDIIGAVISLEIMYRSSLKNSRKINP